MRRPKQLSYKKYDLLRDLIAYRYILLTGAADQKVGIVKLFHSNKTEQKALR